ncbi:MAG: amino acid ABC transporter permease [Aquabacterium sp.]
MPDAGTDPSAVQRPPRRRLRWTPLDTVLVLLLAGAAGALLWRADAVFHYRWDWKTVWPFIVRFDAASGRWVGNLLLDGLLTTLRLAVWGILAAGVIGTVMGLARVSRWRLPRLVAGAYVMLVRNIPPIVFVFVFVFFIASQVMPALAVGSRVATLPPALQAVLAAAFGPARLLDNFLLGLICLSVFSGAYVTEIVRAGLQSVPRAQVEAADSLGFTPADRLRFIVLPQALRNVLPPMAGQFIQLIKDSSLVSLVSIQELSFAAQDVQVTTQRVFEVFVLAGAVYFVICFALSRLFAHLEQRAARAHR